MTRYTLHALNFAVGAVFIYAGTVKAYDPAGFAEDIYNFHLLPWTLTVFLSLYLPWLEIACGVAVIFRRRYFDALVIICGLLLTFIVVLASAWARGLDLTCGCFGRSDDHANYAFWIGRNFALISAVIVLLLKHSKI